MADRRVWDSAAGGGGCGKLGLKRVGLQHQSGPVSSAPDGSASGITPPCLSARISSRMGFLLKHHLLSESQELLRMKTEFFPKRLNHLR